MKSSASESVKVRLQKSQARFKRVRDPKGPDSAVGEFFFALDITATQETVYIPVSIASGKKPTGFVYQIEGTGKSAIATTDISVRGTGVSHITSGTIRYAKIPAGKTATFRILVEMRGQPGKAYSIVINRIHYKFDSNAARYEKHQKEIRSKVVKFG